MMTDREVLDRVTERQMADFYTKFLGTVAEHKFHRTEVKRGLLAYFTELIGESDSYAAAKNFIIQYPYEKERYWRLVFRHMIVYYGYRHCELHLINCAIVARIIAERLAVE